MSTDRVVSRRSERVRLASGVALVVSAVLFVLVVTSIYNLLRGTSGDQLAMNLSVGAQSIMCVIAWSIFASTRERTWVVRLAVVLTSLTNFVAVSLFYVLYITATFAVGPPMAH